MRFLNHCLRTFTKEGSRKPKITRITSKIKVFDPNTTKITRITSKIQVFGPKTSKNSKNNKQHAGF